MKRYFLVVVLCIICSTAHSALLWDSSYKESGVTLSNGNITATISSIDELAEVVFANTDFSTGSKVYWEFKVTNIGIGGFFCFGIANTSSAYNGINWLGESSPQVGYLSSGNAYENGAQFTDRYDAVTVNANDTFMVAVDYNNKAMWIGENGTWLASGNPANGTNHIKASALTFSGASYRPAIAINATNAVIQIFSDGDTIYEPPTGFTHLVPLPSYHISGTLKEKESDASGSAMDYLILNRSTGAVFAFGTAAADGTYSVEVADGTTEYDVYMLDPLDAYAPKTIGELVTGVTP